MNKEAQEFVLLRTVNKEIQALRKELNQKLYKAVIQHGLKVDVDTVVFKETQCKHIIHRININVYREITDAN